MNQPDWERTKEYILARLSKELAPDLTYHGVHHTRDDVLPAAERLAAESKLDDLWFAHFYGGIEESAHSRV